MTRSLVQGRFALALTAAAALVLSAAPAHAKAKPANRNGKTHNGKAHNAKPKTNKGKAGNNINTTWTPGAAASPSPASTNTTPINATAVDDNGTPSAGPSLSQQQFTSTLLPANNSGVTGTAQFVVNGNQLTVNLHASGLVPNEMHPMHIHGFADNRQSVLPPPTADTDGDGFVETPEGEAFIGAPIIPLTLSPPGGSPATDFPVATAAGTIDYSQTFTVDPTLIADLTKRVIEIHGLTVPVGAGAGTPFEVNGVGGYIAEVPVAGGQIVAAGPTPIPLPAAVWSGLTTLGLLAVTPAALRRKPRWRASR
jgi:hypothetical protein